MTSFYTAHYSPGSIQILAHQQIHRNSNNTEKEKRIKYNAAHPKIVDFTCLRDELTGHMTQMLHILFCVYSFHHLSCRQWFVRLYLHTYYIVLQSITFGTRREKLTALEWSQKPTIGNEPVIWGTKSNGKGWPSGLCTLRATNNWYPEWSTLPFEVTIWADRAFPIFFKIPRVYPCRVVIYLHSACTHGRVLLMLILSELLLLNNKMIGYVLTWSVCNIYFSKQTTKLHQLYERVTRILLFSSLQVPRLVSFPRHDIDRTWSLPFKAFQYQV